MSRSRTPPRAANVFQAEKRRSEKTAEQSLADKAFFDSFHSVKIVNNNPPSKLWAGQLDDAGLRSHAPVRIVYDKVLKTYVDELGFVFATAPGLHYLKPDEYHSGHFTFVSMSFDEVKAWIAGVKCGRDRTIADHGVADYGEHDNYLNSDAEK